MDIIHNTYINTIPVIIYKSLDLYSSIIENITQLIRPITQHKTYVYTVELIFQNHKRQFHTQSTYKNYLKLGFNSLLTYYNIRESIPLTITDCVTHCVHNPNRLSFIQVYYYINGRYFRTIINNHGFNDTYVHIQNTINHNNTYLDNYMDNEIVSVFLNDSINITKMFKMFRNTFVNNNITVKQFLYITHKHYNESSCIIVTDMSFKDKIFLANDFIVL